ncbi:MAG: c-type cytochrome [Hyphomicrobiales bacterium]|nr:c-type cytochrome [Hyphomicrobiales bacterium]MDE2114294.1 c-type cytochrome [Hyphomicrobiales bacterium]
MRKQRVFAGISGVLLAGVSLAWVASVQVAESLSRPHVAASASAQAHGAAAFAGAGFGGISTDALASNAVPWRIVAASLVLEERKTDPSVKSSVATLNVVLARFGFLPHAKIQNFPAGVTQPASSLPLGMTYGDISPIGGTKVRVANLGCAACHAGVAYDPDGNPQPQRAMLGMPNTSINLEAYTLAVFKALRDQIDAPDLISTAQVMYPKMGWRERTSLKLIVLPLVRQRLAELAGKDRPLPFTNGAPGSTNGVAALKLALRTPFIDGGLGDAGVVSVPDLGNRTWRSSLLTDGIYAVPGASLGPTTSPPDTARLHALAAITTFFTVASMGVHPDKAIKSLPDAEAIMTFLGSYRAQHFPGRIDRPAAARGQIIYERQCAECHGSYDANLDAPKLTSFPNWRGDVGTDPIRATNFDETLAAAVAKSAYRSLITVRRGRGYVAPPLSGLWASAPYLHNGSVPTLADMLTPILRPRRFMVGGHALDFNRVGLRLTAHGSYPSDYRPFSTPVWIDTKALGRSNQGHHQGEMLSAADKRALIEYLKLL